MSELSEKEEEALGTGELKFHLNHFEGPMDLLIHLIEKNKIQIEDIPIAEITTQYFSYLEEARSMNLEIASNFLLMASQLIKIKVRLLLPRSKESEDPRLELVDKLVEYRFFKDEVDVFQEKYEENKVYHYRQIDEALLKRAYQLKLPLLTMDVGVLTDSLEKILAPFQETPMVIQKENYQIETFVKFIEESASENGLDFEDLFQNFTSRSAVITMFLALLEALRRNSIMIFQKKEFSQILIYPKEV